MRASAFVIFALWVIACAAPQSEPVTSAAPPNVEVQIELDAKTRERLALGLPVHVALRTASTDVGACTLSFDLWEEHYRVAFSKSDVLHAREATDAFARRDLRLGHHSVKAGIRVGSAHKNRLDEAAGAAAASRP